MKSPLRNRTLRWLVPLLCFGLIAAACGSDDDSGGGGGTLVYGVASDVQHFDPALLPAVNFPMIPQLFDSVVRLDDETQPQPALADSWEFSDDQLNLTLNLRDDVVYHDGSPFTAEDVKWNIERYQNPDTGANARVMMLGITSTVVEDDHTIVLGFDAPQAAIFDGLDLLYIVKPTDDLEAIGQNPVGTGPFMLDSYAPGDTISMVRNDDYWREGLPKLDAVEIRVLPDSLAGVVSLETDEIQMLGTPPAEEIDRISELDGFGVLQATSPSVVYDVIFNTESDGPFGDARVRQAVNLAVDRERVIDVLFAGHSEPWCLPWHNGSPAFTEAARDCPRDLDRARELLAEAGYPDGFETSIFSGASETNLLLAQITASNLEEIGITAEIDSVEVPNDRWASGEFEISMHGYGRANRDPATLLSTTSVWRPIDNFARFSSDQYTDLVTNISTTIDADARVPLFEEFDQLLADEMWVISLAPSFMAYAHSDEVEGLFVNLDGMPFLEDVTLGG